MKTKYFLVYIGIGVAFAAASLWVFLSNGKNARAIRAKYKLGGALLTTWALLSAATCNPRIVQPLCYEVAAPTNMVSYSLKDGEGVAFKKGDVMLVTIERPSCQKYEYVFKVDSPEKILQKGAFQIPESEQFAISTTPVEILMTTSYHGAVRFVVYGIYTDSEGKEQRDEVSNLPITLE